MALKVVGTNKVCESRTVCIRPPTDTLPPMHIRGKMTKHGQRDGSELQLRYKQSSHVLYSKSDAKQSPKICCQRRLAAS